MNKITKAIMFKMNLHLYDGVANLEASTDEGMSVEIKTYYEKELLRNAKPQLVHSQFGQKKPIPKGSGKMIEWRKFSKLPTATTPIVEGVLPSGSKRTVSKITATPYQYGDFIRHTDVLETTAIDNVIVEDCREQGDQAGRTVDEIVRDIMQSTSNVMYAGGKTSRSNLTISDVITVNEVFKAANELKRMDITPIDGYYIWIIHPDCSTQLMLDEKWVDVHKYSTAENIYQGEIGKIANVKFVETSQAKIYNQTEGDNTSLGIYGNLLLGANAYGITELQGLGLEYIVKPKGYNDELNLISATGWKTTCGAALLNEAGILRYECCSYRSSSNDTCEN